MQERKLIYSARILVALVVVPSLYIAFTFFFVERRFALERCKVLLFCSYFFTLEQFLVLIDRKKILGIILMVAIVFYTSGIAWNCKIRYGRGFIRYHPN